MKKLPRLLVLILILSVSIPGSAQDTILDGIVAVVGGNIILKSDVEMQYLQYRAQGAIGGSPARVKCEIIENLMIQKLLYHQADVDSITVTDGQVENEMDRRMRYFIAQAGSPDRLEEYYHKSLIEIKEEMRDLIKEQMLVQQEQEKITAGVVVTPSEVKSFFRKLPKDSIPEVPSEIEIGIITRQPGIGKAERELALEQINGFRERIAKGDDFATLAILYSEDPGSAKQGGDLGMFQRGDMRAEFEAAAFKLKPGEVSDVVETEDGLHLIQMIERRGDFINVRHILVQPKVSPVALNDAKLFLDSIATLIQKGEIPFDEAVMRFSDDPSRNNGGMLVNPVTGTTAFEIADVDPKVFFVIDKLKPGEISAPVKWEERGKSHFRLYFLKSRTTPHYANLEEDYARIHEWALEQKKMDVMEKWVDQKAAETFIRIMPPYTDCTFRKTWTKE